MGPDDSDSASDRLDGDDDQGWEDVEDDIEDIKIVSLFDNKTFTSATEMLEDCKTNHDFDIWQLRQNLNLEFLDFIKLVNYIRTSVKSGNTRPDVSSKSCFDDEKYLKPVLKDDALLYSLDDIFDSDLAPSNPLQAEVDSLREQFSNLQSQFTAYRIDVQRSLLDNLNLKSSDLEADQPSTSSSKPSPHSKSISRIPHSTSLADTEYFNSYNHPQIHQIMLSDQVRTDTYRDFIYDNKHLFTNKTVLDVGCGTGILSMFCAKAGAKQVYAVEKSEVVYKARENVWRNGVEGQVRCLHGRVEDVDLPISSSRDAGASDGNGKDDMEDGEDAEDAGKKSENEDIEAKGKVDVIVSEWMGYLLLYESMLDSVIHARNTYLSSTGLMVPSHTTIKLGALVDSNIRVDQVDFWRHVYGFDMSCMLENAFDEVIMQVVDEKEVVGDVVVKELDLYSVSVEDLDFEEEFELIWTGEGRLEGWVLWFDVLFSTDRGLPKDLERVLTGKGHGEGPKGFSTGPRSKSTHWYQGICLIKEPVDGIPVGEVIKGKVKYVKAGEGERGLHIEIEWEVGSRGKTKQLWKLE